MMTTYVANQTPEGDQEAGEEAVEDRAFSGLSICDNVREST